MKKEQKLDVSTKTGEYAQKQKLTPNYIKILDLFVKNYKHHKLEEKEEFMTDEDINQLEDLAANIGELQLIKYLAEDAIAKQNILNGVDGVF